MGDYLPGSPPGADPYVPNIRFLVSRVHYACRSKESASPAVADAAYGYKRAPATTRGEGPCLSRESSPVLMTPGPPRQDFGAEPSDLTAIFFGCTSGFFGTLTLRTPFSRDAWTLSVSAPSGREKLRVNEP